MNESPANMLMLLNKRCLLHVTCSNTICGTARESQGLNHWLLRSPKDNIVRIGTPLFIVYITVLGLTGFRNYSFHRINDAASEVWHRIWSLTEFSIEWIQRTFWMLYKKCIYTLTIINQGKSLAFWDKENKYFFPKNPSGLLWKILV